MGRAKLELPDKFDFCTEIDVRITDINYGGHLGNDSTLSLIHEARTRFLAKYGYREADIEGVGIIMIDAVIIYKGEVFYGDRLRVEVAVDDISQTGCDFYYQLTKISTGKIVTQAKTSIVFFDYQAHKIAKTPKKFCEKIGNNPALDRRCS